jgi:hypothetical protein
MQFTLKHRDGIDFAKSSGDTNRIHLDEIVGYNSLFGEKICHGCLVLIRFLKMINFFLGNKKINSLKIIFLQHFSYNNKIIIKKSKNIYKLYQNKICKAEIIFFEKNNLIYSSLFVKKKYTKKINFKDKQKNVLFSLLGYLSKYVGTIYPGKNSLIREININFNNKENENNKLNKNITFYSKRISQKFSIIFNRMNYQEFNIEFETLFRPVLTLKKIVPEKKIKKKIMDIKKNILIIGASNGIGSELLNLISINKKINIFATYYKNKISSSQNVKFFKLDINKPNKKLLSILKKIKNGYLYYFATPKINIHDNSKKNYRAIKKYYYDFPINISKQLNKLGISLFYPSSYLIDKYKNTSNYCKIKLLAEKKLKKLFSEYDSKLNILRISEVNTKQNLSVLFNNQYPQFYSLLKNKNEYQKKIFFS